MQLTADVTPAVITSSETELSQPINAESLDDQLDIHWEKAVYGVTTEVTYTLEVDAACRDFTQPVVLGSTARNTFAMTLSELNAKLVSDLKLAPHREPQYNCALRRHSMANSRRHPTCVRSPSHRGVNNPLHCG